MDRLAKLFEHEPPATLVVNVFEGVGELLYSHAVAIKLEGMAGKRMDSPYVPQGRSPNRL